MAKARIWIKKKNGIASDAGRFKDEQDKAQKAVADSVKFAKLFEKKHAEGCTLDESFFSSFGGLSYYEKQKLLDIRRFSEFSDVWKDYSNFDRADILGVLVSKIDNWYAEKPARSVTLTLEMTLSATSTSSDGLLSVHVTPILRTPNQLVPSTRGNIQLFKPKESSKSSADVRLSRKYDDTGLTPGFRSEDFLPEPGGWYTGHLHPALFTGGESIQKIAQWNYFAVVVTSGSPLNDLEVVRTRLILTFEDSEIPRSLQLTQGLTLIRPSHASAVNVSVSEFTRDIFPANTSRMRNSHAISKIIFGAAPKPLYKSKRQKKEEPKNVDAPAKVAEPNDFLTERVSKYVYDDYLGIKRLPDEDRTRKVSDVKAMNELAEQKKKLLKEIDQLMAGMK